MALFKILGNFNSSNSITSLTSHNQGYCYFDINTNKFYIDTSDTEAGLRQLNGTYYAECSTESQIINKTITVPGLHLLTGITVFVKFLNANSASAPMLVVNGGEPHAIMQYGNQGNMSNPDTSGWPAGAIVPLTYDGNVWYKAFGYNSNTTYTNALLGQGYCVCSTAAGTVAKTAGIVGYTLLTGGIVVVNFVNAVPANATLNINS